MDEQTKKIILIVVAVVVIIFVLYFAIGFLTYERVTEKIEKNGPHSFNVEINLDFNKNSNERTLTVDKIRFECDVLFLLWEDVEVTMGSATLPSGLIMVGDVVTNCSGSVELTWIPANALLCSYVFEE